MGDTKAKEVQIKGSQLICPVCKGTNFWIRKSMLNTRGMLAHMDIDLTNKATDNYVCDNCGYLMRFLPKER